MAQNRVKELRKSRGLTLMALAEKAGMSHTYLSRIEQGSRGLSVPVAERLATALEVSVTHVLGVQAGKVALPPEAGLAEDAEPYAPGPSDRLLVRPRKGDCIDPWKIKTNAIDRAGIRIGMIVFVDISAEAVDNVQPLQCVVAQVYDPNELTKATTVVRQFVPPSLLISNTSGAALPILDIDKGEAAIKGVIIGRYDQF